MKITSSPTPNLPAPNSLIKSYRTICETESLHIIEFKPQMRTIRIQMVKGVEVFYLSFPYIQFAKRDNGRYNLNDGFPRYELQVTVSLEPAELKSRVYAMPLQNVWRKVSICLGGRGFSIKKMSVEDLVHWFLE